MIKIKKRTKKLLSTTVALAVLLVYGNGWVVIAQAPTPPSAPTAPENTNTAPESPDAPEAPDAPENTNTAPEAPDAPEAPTYEEATSESDDNSEEDEEEWEGEEEDSTKNSEEDQKESTSSEDSTNKDENSSNDDSESKTQGVTSDGQVGDTKVDTGDATNTGSITTKANTNTSTKSKESGSDGDSGGVKVVNKDNGSDSDNSGSVSVTNDNETVQDNSAGVANDLGLSTNTGENSASKNTGGDSEIKTGDANTTGTILNSINSNLDGVSVYEFNIDDSHTGDYLLDFSSANCISGCPGGDTTVANTGNGADSENNAEFDSETNNTTFQTNDATIENNMTLDSNSGNNQASKNTGGGSSIETGDANVAANSLTFVNNNVAGDVVYGVVNIFGDLQGDIILPDGTVIPCCIGGDTTVANTGNGSDSTNDASVNQTNNNETYQFNAADIDNNLYASATTGGNDASANTGGNNEISTGDSSISANVVNFANNNIAGGDWWLVIVNEAGKWIGKILGAPDGSHMAGSDGFDITTDENGEILVSNNGNGSGSTNNAAVDQETNNTTVQNNNAKVTNNINLSANTGGNSASKNTNGNSSIETGDANVVANIVNFVNNNIVGSGRLFVTMVNVFGDWVGDFVGPGYEAQANSDNNDDGNNNDESGIGGPASHESNNSSSNSDSNPDNHEEETANTTSTEQTGGELAFGTSFVNNSNSGVLSDIDDDNSDETTDSDEKTAAATEIGSESESAGERVVSVNLAWGILALPIILGYIVVRKKRLFAKALAKIKK